MPGKMARSDARPSVRVTRALVAVSTSRLSCKRAGANANIDAGLGFIWRISAYWTVEGYRSDTQGLPPRYADRGSADESRERGCRGAHRRADAARLHARSKPDIRSPWCGGQIEPNAATNAGTEDSQCRCRGDSRLSGSAHRQIIGHPHGHCDRLG